jgi:hypothetical protein
VAAQALAYRIYRAVQRTIEALSTGRAVRDVNQACGRRIGARRTLHWRLAAPRAVVTRRAHIVDSGVQALYASLAHVADLQTGLAALVRSGHRAATAAEVTLSALGCGRGETLRSTVVSGSARRALRDILEIGSITVGAVGTQELLGRLRPRRAVASLRAVERLAGVQWTVVPSRTGLRNMSTVSESPWSPSKGINTWQDSWPRPSSSWNVPAPHFKGAGLPVGQYAPAGQIVSLVSAPVPVGQ